MDGIKKAREMEEDLEDRLAALQAQSATPENTEEMAKIRLALNKLHAPTEVKPYHPTAWYISPDTPTGSW